MSFITRRVRRMISDALKTHTNRRFTQRHDAPTRVRKFQSNLVLHVGGPSGCGKTSLGERVRKEIDAVVVVDTDEFYDECVLHLLFAKSNAKKWTTIRDSKAFVRRVKMCMESAFRKRLGQYHNRTIVLTGHIHPGMQFIIPFLARKYEIQVDAETLMRQYHLRTLAKIQKHSRAIKHILATERVDRVHWLLFAKFGIRTGFDCVRMADFKNIIRNQRRFAREDKSKYMSSDDIFRDIQTQFKKQK